MNQLHQFYRPAIQVPIKLIILLGFISIGLSACKNNGEIVPVVRQTSVNVVNADVNSLNFYLNGARLNQISSLSPNSESGYLPVPVGTNIYQFKIAGASDYIINNYSLTLDTLQHSLFAAGETPDKLFLIKDIPIALTGTQAAIRVVNASPGSTGLTIYVGGTYNVTGSAFKSANDFKPITADTYVVSVYQGSAPTAFYTKPVPVTLTASTTYTLFTSGQVNGTGNNAFNVSLIVN